METRSPATGRAARIRTGIALLAALTVACVVVRAASRLSRPTPSTAPPAAIAIDYPQQGSIFPPDFAPPTFLWRDSDENANTWEIEVTFADRSRSIKLAAAGEHMKIGEIDERCIAPTNELPKLSLQQAASRTWVPDNKTWETIKKHSVKAPATVTVAGWRDGVLLSRGQVTIQTSKDPVSAPIFYRDVPLMPSEAQKGVIKPLPQTAIPLIAWRLRNVSETRSKAVMEGVHTCANCHSASRDGKVMAMDVDGPNNDKGLYAIFPLQPKTAIRNENVVAWSSFRGKLGGKLRVAFMPQLSPNGQFVVATINDPGADLGDVERRKRPKDMIGNYYVANFKDYRFLQVFYPTRGILAWYSKTTGRLDPLPGADDTHYVHTNPVWTPDGKYLVFARAEAREAYAAGAEMAGYANDPNETQIQYDLYRMPFNDGKGGQPEPIAGASHNGMSNSFARISPDGRWIVFVQARNGLLMRPDSKLFIVPFVGGEPRQMRCNTPLMNSWHSFSPNGRWLVFSSKSRSPYTQMYLTHIDENGQDSPAILVENSTAANRAVNLPEFLNIRPDGLQKIDAPVTDLYAQIDRAAELSRTGKYDEAVAEWKQVIDQDPQNAEAYNSLGAAMSKSGKASDAIAYFEKALQISPDSAQAYTNLGSALAEQGRLEEAIPRYEKALELDPRNAGAHNNLGLALVAGGKIGEAIAHYEQALAASPGNAEAHNNLGIALARQGRLEEAVAHLQQATSLTPESADFEYNFARVLAASGRFADAVPHAENAVKASGGRDPVSMDTLGGLYAELGRFRDAVRVAQRALELATEQHNEALVQTLKARLAMYEEQLLAASP